jgi:RNA polymerase sigma factor (sigma-70 family)
MECSAALTETSAEHDEPTDDRLLWATAGDLFGDWRDRGDAARFEQLVRLLTPVLWQVVRAAGTDEEQARDVLQTVWLTLVRCPDSVRDNRAVGHWLVISARRESWRVVGRDRRSVALDPARVPEPEPGSSAEIEALQVSDTQVLWLAVSRLSARCQRLARVAASLELTDYKSLAADLGLAVGSVGVIRRRCLDALRADLEQQGVTGV